MIVAAEQEVHGATELAFEAAGVGGWDDIVTFQTSAQRTVSTHWQVKNQNTDFEVQAGAIALGQYFIDALELTRRTSPYGGAPAVLGTDILFNFAVPSLGIGYRAPRQNAANEFRVLQKLCDACSGGAHTSVAQNGGALLSSGAEREWLNWVITWTGAPPADVTRLLSQMTIVEMGDERKILDDVRGKLGVMWADPIDALLRLSASVARCRPEGRVHVRDIWEALLDSPRRIASPCALRRHDDKYFQFGARDVRELVERAWARTLPAQVNVDFAPEPQPATKRRLRSAVVRLALHCGGVKAVSHADWWAVLREELQGAIGNEGGCDFLSSCFIQPKAPPPVAIAKAGQSCDASGLALLLEQAMDAWLERDVVGRVELFLQQVRDQALARLLQVAWQELSPTISQNWSEVYKRLLGALGEPRTVPPLRAGPLMAQWMARTIELALVLRALRYLKWTVQANGDFATIGSVPVRALALARLSCPDEGADRVGGVPLFALAERVLGDAPVYILGACGSAADLQLALNTTITTYGSPPPKSTSARVTPIIIAYDHPFEAALLSGTAALKSYVNARRDAASNDVREQFDAAILRLKEVEDAA